MSDEVGECLARLYAAGWLVEESRTPGIFDEPSWLLTAKRENEAIVACAPNRTGAYFALVRQIFDGPSPLQLNSA